MKLNEIIGKEIVITGLLSKTVLDDEIIMNMMDVKSFEMGISNPLRRLVIS